MNLSVTDILGPLASYPRWSSNRAWQDKNSPKLRRRPRWISILSDSARVRPSVRRLFSVAAYNVRDHDFTSLPRSGLSLSHSLSASLFETRNIINSCIKRSSFSPPPALRRRDALSASRAAAAAASGPLIALYGPPPSLPPSLNGPSTARSVSRPRRHSATLISSVRPSVCPRPRPPLLTI